MHPRAMGKISGRSLPSRHRAPWLPDDMCRALYCILQKWAQPLLGADGDYHETALTRGAPIRSRRRKLRFCGGRRFRLPTYRSPARKGVIPRNRKTLVAALVGRLEALHSALGGQPQTGHATGAIGAILQGQRAAMPFGDLAAQYQADAGASGLGGKE